MLTLAVFLTIDCSDSDAAEYVVDDLLDAGFFQDAINEHLPDGCVTCAVVRAVGADVLTAHDAHPEPDGESDAEFRARIGERPDIPDDQTREETE